MDSVLTVTAPICLLIAAGFAAERWGWMAPEDMRVLGRFVAQFCVPALLFSAPSRWPRRPRRPRRAVPSELIRAKRQPMPAAQR